MTTRPLRIAIVGAGAAGLCTAKVLLQAGHQVTVFDRTPDVGGVWSRTRRYPGVQTQSPRDTYAFSDFPMPASYPEWPSGEQVQAYFESYADHFGVLAVCRLDTLVESTRPNDSGGWTVTSRGLDAAEAVTEDYDRLVVANGVFCEPSVPEFVGRDEFEAAGGRLTAVTDLHDAEDARGRHALVIGYGKSACDAAVAISEVTADTTLIARQMLWKVPRKIGGVVNFKYLLLTRMGEALFRFAYLRGAEKFLHGVGNPIRRNMVNSVGSAFARQYKLKKLGLMPAGTMEDIVKGAIGLVTE
ncbi:NAD(P)/FAD-dependent oxidoreductase, partial [Jatrophihabitans endophyticus]|uniref:flavin-containing monooxygenase n=1 Tax=Jatrophihabitans endophyticus TaxID=1206085 RepID=UPI001A0C8F63